MENNIEITGITGASVPKPSAPVLPKEVPSFSSDGFSYTLNVVAAFIAGLAVVGVVYAFAVQGSFGR